MQANKLRDYTDQGVANVIVGLEMPGGDIPDKTQIIGALGASNMLRHMLSDSWGPHSHQVMSEFISRLIANAQKQGIDIDYQPVTEDSSP